MRYVRTPFLIAVCGLVLGSSLEAADPVRIPGTNTSLQAPVGFVPAESFPGFQHPGLGASIMVTELPLPGARLMGTMTKEDGLATRGMTLLSSKAEKVSGRDALLLEIAQTTTAGEFLRWMLLTGDDKASVIIAGIFPKNAGEQVSSVIRSSVLTASWNPESSQDPFEGLQFQVTPTEKLKLSNRLGNLLTFTESGSPDPSGPGEPIYMVGNSLVPGGGELRSLSEERARQTEHIHDLQNISGREITVGGLAAYELLADAKDVRSGAAVRLYQVIVPDGGSYFLVQGFVGPERAAEMLPEFRRVTESFRKTAVK